MKRITFTRLACLTFLTVLVAAGFAPQATAATPNPSAAVVKTRIFNDCPPTTVNVVNNYPSLISIEDVGLACSGFANLHNWSFSEDGSTAALFDNNADYRFSADLVLDGTFNGEAGLRISPWWSPDVDGRFNIRTPDGEIACFGGRLPFYSFTGAYGLHYVKGELIHLEIVYRPNGLSSSSPATIEYNVTYQGATYGSGPLNFDQANPAEDPPHGLWGELNEARAGGYVQPRMDEGNFSASVKATFTNIHFAPCQPKPTAALVKTRIFNDCPPTTINVVNNYPSSISIEDVGLACSGFANLHNWTFSDDGVKATVFNNNSDFRFAADLLLSGSGTGEAGLRISPWWSPDVDGRFNIRVPDGEIACFGGRLPFYSFTGAYGLHYVKGDPIHLEIIYKPNHLSSTNPATIEYNLTYLGNTYGSGPLNFDMANPAEDPPHGLWGMLNNGRAGGYVQPRMDEGNFSSAFKAEWSNITFHAGPDMGFDLTPDAINFKANGSKMTAYLTPPAPYSASEIDVSTILLNGAVAVDPSSQPTISGNTLIVKFNRVDALAAVGQSGQAVITGEVSVACFSGSDVVKVLHVSSPTAGSSHAPGSVVDVRWTTPPGASAASASIYSSIDNGQNWSTVVENVANSGSYAWTLPATLTHAARVAVVADDGTTDGIVGISSAFNIEGTTGVGGPSGVEFALRGVTPNPSKGEGVHVDFSLPNAGRATLSLFDVSGRRVVSREVGGLGAGHHNVTLAERLPAGMYMVRLSQGGRSLSTSAAVVR